jgi:RNA polymerase sigma-70 factor (ECF subfamily)
MSYISISRQRGVNRGFAARGDRGPLRAGAGPSELIALENGGACHPESLQLGQVYEAEFDYVFRCLRGLGVRADVLDDALQDVFLVVSDKLAEFDGRARLRTWLYAIVLRVARRYRERAAKEARRFVSDEREQAPCAEGAEELVLGGLQRNADLARAQRALRKLDPRKREIFVLSAIEQLSAPEIATITELPLNTVYSRMRSARIAFDEQVARLTRARTGSRR